MKIRYGIAAIVVVALLWLRQSNEPLTYYSSRSYVQRTNDLIRRGALIFDCRDNRVKLTPRATDAERDWYAASYLQNDVELFNRNRELFGHFFVVSDCQLREINPFLRTVTLPFATSSQWLGNIEYAGPGSDATLVSASGRGVAITRTEDDALPRDGRTIAGDPKDVAANVVHIDFAGGGRTPAVEVHSVEGTAVLEQRVKRGHPGEVRLLGNALNEGRITRLQSGDWLHLSSTSPRTVSETFLYTGERRYDRLSTIRTRNAERERIFTEEDPLLQWVGGDDGEEMLTFGEALARSINNALLQIDPIRAKQLLDDFDVQLSIDRALQSDLDAMLRSYAGGLANSVGGGDPFAASITVMNGKSGEILAVASWPGQSDLASMTIADDQKRRLLVNHNFKRHPIGSAGKPFFYAAIATRHPFLLDFTVAPHAPQARPDGGDGEREVLQFFVGTDYKLWPHADERMDMESAIERSCNKFTVELATIALAAPRDLQERTLSLPLDRVFARQVGVAWTAVDPPQIAGQPIDFPVSLGVYMKDDGRPVPPRETTDAVITPGTLDRIDEAPFVEAFGDITGVRTYAGGAAPRIPDESDELIARSANVTLNYDLRPWRDLLGKLTEGESDERAWKVRAALQSVSPERVNLSLNQVTDFRTEFVSLLLGGSTSLWTNVQLAEALSRLVTKREVEATMIRTIRPRHPSGGQALLPVQSFADLAISDAARETVLRGMKRVALGTRGTARPMATRIAELEQRFPGYNVALFSKTGSPTVKRPESKPAGALLRELVRRGHLYFDGRQLVVSVSRSSPPVPHASRAAFVAALRRAAQRTGLPATPRTIARLAAITDRFSRYRNRFVFDSPSTVRLSESTNSPIHVVAGQLVLNRDHPLFDPIEQSDSSAVYIFTLAKWRGTSDIPTPAELAEPDSRVITVALYLDIGPGSEVAVEGGREVVGRLGALLE